MEPDEQAPVRGKRIGFVLFNYPLGVSTMLINSIALLARDNEVDVLVSRADRRDLPLDGWLEKLLVAYPDFSNLLVVGGFKFLHRKFASLLRLPAGLAWLMDNLDLYLFSAWLGKQARRRQYDIVIAVECFSLIAVARACPAGGDVIYYNLELLDWAAENPLYQNKAVLKKLEHAALGRVSHVMITSPERGTIFANINRYPPDRVSALPVAPLRQRQANRTRYFRDRFGIGDERLLLVYSGNFEPWAQCLEIIASMDGWPRNAVLVMHTWNRAAMARDYFAQMSRAAEGRPVHFSSEYLRYEELAPALSSADIGLLYYQAIDANFTEILFSSNKMAEYMAAGVPVICSAFPSLAGFVEAEGIGVAADFGAIGAAAGRIAADMERFRGNVARCRQRHFEFEPHFTRAFSAYARAGSGRPPGHADV